VLVERAASQHDAQHDVPVPPSNPRTRAFTQLDRRRTERRDHRSHGRVTAGADPFEWSRIPRRDRITPSRAGIRHPALRTPRSGGGPDARAHAQGWVREQPASSSATWSSSIPSGTGTGTRLHGRETPASSRWPTWPSCARTDPPESEPRAGGTGTPTSPGRTGGRAPTSVSLSEIAAGAPSLDRERHHRPVREERRERRGSPSAQGLRVGWGPGARALRTPLRARARGTRLPPLLYDPMS
jgi:hypothetical protein